MGDKELIAGILHYQHGLEKYTRRNDEARVLYCLSKLYKMPICIEHLEKTGVGRTVNSLRKLNGDIGEAAKTLVGKWKEMVAAISDEKETDSVPKIEPVKKFKPEKEINSSHRGSDKRSSFLSETNTKSHSKKNQEESSSSGEEIKSKRDGGKSRHSQSSSVSDDENNSKRKEYSKHKSKRKRDSSEESESESESEKHKSKYHKSRADETKNKKKHYESSDEETPQSKQAVRKKTDEKASKSSSHRDKEADRQSSKHRKTNSKRLTSGSEDEEIVKSKHKSHSSRDQGSSSKHKKSSRDNEKEESRKSKHKSSKKDEKSSSKPKPLSDIEEYTNKNGFASDESDSDLKVEKKKSRNDEKKDKEPKSRKSKGSSDKSDKTRHSKSEKKNSRKTNIEIGENGIGSGSGASFAEALGMCISSSKAIKKKVAVVRPYSPDNEASKVPELLATSKKLTPLDVTVDNLLPEITPHYRPMGLPFNTGSKKVLNEDEALGALMYSKFSRTKVYSGNKVTWGTVPSLFDICTRVLQDNIDALEYTGGVPYLILKPVIERANPDQLFMLEHHNPYLIDDTDELWQLHCNKEFRSKKREELETWRDMYMRCLDEREAKLQALTANIKQSQDKSLPVRQTKLAYVDSVVKPPRNILRKQAKHGIGVSDKRPAITPSARLSQIAVSGAAGQVAVPNPGPRAASSTGASNSTAIVKPKKAPLMQKTLALMKSRIFRR